MRERIREIIQQTCEEMGAHIVRGVLARDHVFIFLSIPPKLSLLDVMQRIKGRSSRRIQMEFPELHRRYWGRRFLLSVIAVQSPAGHWDAWIFLDHFQQCDERYHHAVSAITFRTMMLPASAGSPSLRGSSPGHMFEFAK